MLLLSVFYSIVCYHFQSFIFVVLEHSQKDQILSQLGSRFTNWFFRADVLIHLNHIARAIVENSVRILPVERRTRDMNFE